MELTDVRKGYLFPERGLVCWKMVQDEVKRGNLRFVLLIWLTVIAYSVFDSNIVVTRICEQVIFACKRAHVYKSCLWKLEDNYGELLWLY